ncbi:MAG: class I SAM-dependent methyltransferase [Candidatus Firestonebacteria bacterium]
MTNISKKEIDDLIIELSSIRWFKYPYQIIPTDSEWQREFTTTKYHYYDLFSFFSDININNESKVLEVGLGYGYIALWVKMKYHCSVYAIEHPSRATVNNIDFCAQMGDRGIKIIKADLLQEFPFEDGFFDMIIFSEVLEHIQPQNVKHIMNELTRVLKNSGKMIITTPNVATLHSRYRALRGINPQPFPIQSMSDETYEHIRIYTLEELERICVIYNLKILKIKHSNHYKGKFWSDIRKKLITSVFPSFSDEIFLHVVKQKV